MARKTPELNASSMADIAFLLLIFFLVTTTMDVDSGIYRKLPPIPEESNIKPPKVKERNVLIVLVNRNNELLVNGEVLKVSQLRDKAKEFILNPGNSVHLPEKKAQDIPLLGRVLVSKGLVSLMNDRGTQYATYITVQNELAAAYREVRDGKSMQQWGKKFEDLSVNQQLAVRKYIPMQVSEAEPKSYGGKK